MKALILGRRSFSRRRRAFSATKSAPAGGIAARVWGRRGDPACPPSPLFRQARSLEGAIPSSPAIWRNGRPWLANSPTASRLNSSVYGRRDVPIKHLPAPSGAYQKVHHFEGGWGVHARTISGSRRIVFLFVSRGAGAGEASFAAGKGAGSGGSERPGPPLREALFERGPPRDPTGAIAERLAAPGVLRHPLGTPAEGTARL